MQYLSWTLAYFALGALFNGLGMVINRDVYHHPKAWRMWACVFIFWPFIVCAFIGMIIGAMLS